MNIAIVHEWLDTWAGSEQVLAEMLKAFPDATLFALVDFLPDVHRDKLGGRRAQTSFLQRLPLAHRRFRNYLPLMPLAVEQFDLRGFDVVISNSHAVAKGILTAPQQLHLCYCYSPPRYAWDLRETYLGRGNWIKRYLLHRFRLWDVAAGQRPDVFLAISNYVARRIAKCYRRDAAVLYPPCATEWFTPGAAARDTHYFSHSRFVPYKRIEVLIEAFRQLPERELRLAGEGPERRRLQALAPPNVRFLGRIDDQALREELRTARAFLFAAEEDFGLAPLEAQACGTPVIAFAGGGVVETLGGAAGCNFFHAQEPGSVREAIDRFEASGPPPDAERCRSNILRFSRQAFREQLRRAVDTAWTEHRTRQAAPTESGR